MAEAILPVAITLERNGSGWAGTVDVPSQYALSYPLTQLRVDSATVAFSFSDLLPPGLFEGQRVDARFRDEPRSVGELNCLMEVRLLLP